MLSRYYDGYLYFSPLASPTDAIYYIHIPFEEQIGDVISHSIYQIDAHNGARIQRRGRVGNGLLLDGRTQYAVIEDQRDSCFGNIQRYVGLRY